MSSFINWSRTHRVTPREWIAPSSEDELAEALAGESRAGRAIHAVGSGHSWSDAAVPVDVAVDLSRLRGVEAIVDSGDAPPTITVRAGTRLEEITAALDVRGLAMPILGSIAKQTIAGAIATATHGSSLRYGNLSSLVSSMRLVTSRGERLTLSKDDPRLAAGRVHLGALGVVTSVSLRVTRAFTLAETREPVPFRDLLDNLATIANSAEYVKIWWLPSVGQAVVFRYERTREPASFNRVYSALDEKLINGMLFEVALRGVGAYPAATAYLNRAVASTYLRPGRRVARSDRAFNLAMPPIHREAEWAFPMSEAAGALDDLARTIATHGLRINFPCEIRFVKADDNWMSPAYGMDVCHVGIYQADSPDLTTYFAAAAAIARRRRGRPHWGKELALGPDEIGALFPRATEFRALACELDPDGALENPFLARVLGPRRRVTSR